MEQLGCILLGFTVAAPAVVILSGVIRAWEDVPPKMPREPLGRPVPRCDPRAVAVYFGSLLQGSKAEAGQPLSAAELTALLAGPGGYASPAGVRFDSEGGYRLRL